MLSDEWLSRYGLLENFNASVTRTRTRTGTRTGTGTWTTGVTAIALCTLCSRAKKSHIHVSTCNSRISCVLREIVVTEIHEMLKSLLASYATVSVVC